MEKLFGGMIKVLFEFLPGIRYATIKIQWSNSEDLKTFFECHDILLTGGIGFISLFENLESTLGCLSK
jgi:hypothetical protein